jgi:hypothetical protein
MTRTVGSFVLLAALCLVGPGPVRGQEAALTSVQAGNVLLRSGERFTARVTRLDASGMECVFGNALLRYGPESVDTVSIRDGMYSYHPVSGRLYYKSHAQRELEARVAACPQPPPEPAPTRNPTPEPLPPVVSAPPTPEERPTLPVLRPIRIGVAPAERLDEELWLVFILNQTYEQWPRPTADRDQLARWLRATHPRMELLAKVIQKNKLDPRLLTLHRDCIELIGQYTRFLITLGQIDKETAEETWKVVRGIGERGLNRTGQVLGEVGDELVQAIMKDPYAGLVGVGVAGGIGFVWGAIDEWIDWGRRVEERRNEIERAGAALSRATEDTHSRANALALELTRSRGWLAGECGLDNFKSDDLDELVRRRPRDPFLRVQQARSGLWGKSANVLLTEGRACAAAAASIPEGKVYDDYRSEGLLAAALRLTDSGAVELDGAYSRGPSRAAPDAIAACRSYLRLVPKDPSGRGNMLLARALAMNGDYAGAVRASAEARPFHGDAAFAYRCAKLHSLSGDTDRALEWFDRAITSGFPNVPDARATPDLEALRRANRDAFARILKPRFEWRIEWGILGPDKIILTNKSPFPLTGVRLKLRVTSTGSPDWHGDLACDAIEPGGEYVWPLGGPKSITSRGSDWKGTAELFCDQN